MITLLISPLTINQRKDIMDKKDIDFLMRYAKIGILKQKGVIDDLDYEEIKQEYVRIKRTMSNLESTQAFPLQQSKNEEKKPSAISKWFSGIGDRQRKYKELHKDDLL